MNTYLIYTEINGLSYRFGQIATTLKHTAIADLLCELIYKGSVFLWGDTGLLDLKAFFVCFHVFICLQRRILVHSLYWFLKSYQVLPCSEAECPTSPTSGPIFLDISCLAKHFKPTELYFKFWQRPQSFQTYQILNFSKCV